jgi:hypothetical protein
MFRKNQKIYIDFQGGSHGNYLEFVCNRFLAGVVTTNTLPFNDLGAAHRKKYTTDSVFKCDHFTTANQMLTNETVIMIKIVADDLLPLQCISLLRAGDYDIRPDALEHDTYHKLHNVHYQCVLDNLIESFFHPRHLVAGYTAIADASWPKIQDMADYLALPDVIRDECEQVHGIEIYQLDADHPHCPRHILKEFFRIGFADPDSHGFIKPQNTLIHQHCNVYDFPFSVFYDTDRFSAELHALAAFLDMPVRVDLPELHILHQEFLLRQPYRSVKAQCDLLVEQLTQDPLTHMPDLDVIQDAYVAHRLEASHG